MAVRGGVDAGEAVVAVSATAQMTAFGRAMHLVRDDSPHLLVDALAWPLLGPSAEPLLELSRELSESEFRTYRANWVFRSVATERRLLAAVERGVRQYVVLGAGLDSSGWRHEALLRTVGARVFEVDQPVTQDWKRRRLRALGVRVPEELVFAPSDFATDDVLTALGRAGFDSDAPAFFNWLGVTMYLTREASLVTLQAIAAVATGSSVVLSYSVPAASVGAPARQARVIGAAMVAERGEPWISHYTPGEIEALAREAGFSDIRHVSDDEAGKLFARRGDGLKPNGVERLLVATV